MMMTPEDHYAEADRYLAKIEELLKGFPDEKLFPGIGTNAALVQTFEQAITRQLALVQAHATLALKQPAPSICGHGNSGLCMDCLTFTLERSLERLR